MTSANPDESPPGFSSASTLLWALAWAAVMLHGWGDLIAGPAASWLYDPVRAAHRIANRDLELAIGAEASSGWPGRVRSSLHPSVEESLEESIEIHRDLVAMLEAEEGGDGEGAGGGGEEDAESRSTRQAHRARIQLAILLAEAGSLDEAVEVAGRRGHESTWARDLTAIYSGPRSSEVGGTFLTGLDWLGFEDWLIDSPTARFLDGSGSKTDADSLEASIVERGTRWMIRAEALMMANLLLVVMGTAVLGVPLLRRRWLEDPPEAQPPPWTLAVGIGVLIRGDFWGRLYLVLLGGSSYEFQSSTLGTLLLEWSTLLAAIPLLWLGWRYLVRPLHREGQSRPDPFGLHPRRWAHASAAGIALAAIAAELLGTGILGWSSLLVGSEGGWAEGFDETLAFGSLSDVLLTSFDYVVMAPIVEELAFRGILYFSLRRRLGPWQAAVVSAAIFSSVHFYSLPGFLTTFWSGAIWALAFERTRSLVPGIAAHAVYNLLYVAGWTLIYR